MEAFRKLEINGGLVTGDWAESYQLVLPAVSKGYADAQLDDYGGRKRRDYLWQPGTRMRLKARFSHSEGELVGTAGFGFWNAPYGDPTVPWPTLPQTAWFFFGSPPNDFPLALDGPGRGWFASTLDARSCSALALVPMAPAVLLLTRFKRLRTRIWPPVRQRLGITFRPLAVEMSDWHTYQIDWLSEGCAFFVDGQLVLQTPVSPGGPLGFVCWIDNQYLRVTVDGRVGWGTLPVSEPQSLFIRNLEIGLI
jgi:hypothetical protein